ncbi:MAG: ribosomal protein methyltransferase [Pseudomonadota bacterium]|jgi:ribosomal protein L11 methyltransferase
MAWLQLHFDTVREHVERLSDFLVSADALSVTWQACDEQDLFEPPLESTPLWQNVKISALFAADTPLRPLIDALQAQFDEKIILACRCESLAEQVWERVWLNEFKPMRFGEKLWVCPSAYQPPDETAVNIILDPGLAFGTGTHPSTALCLEWLEANPIQGKTIIDYGCGSGILSIAGLKLGANKVIAVDHDPQALEASLMNAQRNQLLSEQLDCVLAKEFHCKEPVDILLANILAQPLMDLASYFKCLIKPAGHCVLAGILTHQVESVQRAYRQAGFKIADISYKQDWACLVGNSA